MDDFKEWTMAESSNFAFLKEHDPVFLQLASSAERVFASDPNTTLVKLRQLGEALAQDLAARAGIELDAIISQTDLLYRLGREIQLDGNIRSLFHTLRPGRPRHQQPAGAPEPGHPRTAHQRRR